MSRPHSRMAWAAFVALAPWGCGHATGPKPLPRPQALSTRPPVQAAQDALERAHHGPASLHAADTLKAAEKTVRRALAKARRKDGGADADDLAYLGRRQVQLAESQSGRAVANARASQAYEELQILQPSARGAEVGQLIYARRSGSLSPTALHEGPWEQQPGLGIVLPLLGDRLFAAHDSVLSPQAIGALQQVAQALTGADAELGVMPVGQTRLPQALVAARSRAICAYLAQAGLQVAPMAQVPPGLGPDAGRSQNSDLWLLVLTQGP